MRNSRIEVKPIAGALGAEIYGAAIANDLDDGVIGEIRQALRQALDRGLIAHHQIQDRHLTGEARKMFEEVIREAA